MSAKPASDSAPEVSEQAEAIIRLVRPALARFAFEKATKLAGDRPDLGDSSALHVAVLLELSRKLAVVLHEEGRIAIDRVLESARSDDETATIAIARLTKTTGLARSGVMFAFGRARQTITDVQSNN
jgi:hypothetical protein